MPSNVSAPEKKINLNEIEAAEIYGPSVHWFRRARWAGGGPAFIKLNGMVLYERDELDRYFRAHTVRSNAEAAARASTVNSQAAS